MEDIVIPLIVRGEALTDDLVRFDARRGLFGFLTPDVSRHLDRIALRDPLAMQDLYALSLEDVFDYLEALGKLLSLDRNPHLRSAFELSSHSSGLGRETLEFIYRESMPGIFCRPQFEEMIEQSIGRPYLEGWVGRQLLDRRTVAVRAFGARTVHINAGNNPMVAALSLLRNALIRGDAIVKSPSNDPLTAAALAQTMIEMAPGHPLTRHFSVAYWKGGDTAFEDQLYRNTNIEKIVAWGGFASMRHIARYLGPGIDLVAMDPKLSCTLIGREAFDSDERMREVAIRLACDIGARNQEPCTSARVVYCASGTRPEGVAKLERFGEYVYAEIQALPLRASGPHPAFNRTLREEIDGIRTSSWHKVIGGKGNLGAIIVSRLNEPVDFSDYLGCRVGNLVPIDEESEMLDRMTVHTQTIGIYPESLKQQMRDRLALCGGQRVVSLGHQNNGNVSTAHDAIEPMRRMVRWIIDETIESATPSWATNLELSRALTIEPD